MRQVLFLFPLLLLGGAQAEEAGQPDPAEGQCAELINNDWTPQEKFVWRRVCNGETANFNDPVVEPKDSYGGDLDPQNSKGWSQRSVLTPIFLKTILLNEPYRSAMRGRGVHIKGARFTENLNLANAELSHDLWLERSLFENGVNFSALRSTRSLGLEGSKIKGTLDMRELHIGDDLRLNATAIDDANLRLAHIGGIVYLIKAKVKTELNMERINVGAQLLMCSGSQFANVALDKARVGGTLSLRGSRVTGVLGLNSIQVGEDLELNAESGDDAQFNDVNLTFARINGRVFLDDSEVTGSLAINEADIGSRLSMRSLKGYKVALIGTHVGGTVDLTTSQINSEIDMKGFQADRNVFMGHNAEYQNIFLDAAHIGRRLNISAASVAGVLSMNKLRVYEDLQMNNSRLSEVKSIGARVDGMLGMRSSHITGNLDMKGMSVGQDVLMDSSTFDGNVLLIASHVGGRLTLDSTKVAKHLHCWNMEVDNVSMEHTQIDGPITFNDVKIKGGLNIDSAIVNSFSLKRADIGGELKLGNQERWSDTGTLDLSGAKIGLFPGLSDAWPPRVEVDGLTYRMVGSFDNFQNWFRRTEHNRYSPQPYEQLAGVVSKQGNPELAKDIRYESREAARKHAWMNGAWDTWAWQTVLKYVIGYGLYPHWALGWAIGLWFAGVIVLHLSGEAKERNLGIGFVYSFDMLLPIFGLREANKKIELKNASALRYFYVHKIIGFTLATFLVAALAGLTQ